MTLKHLLYQYSKYKLYRNHISMCSSFPATLRLRIYVVVLAWWYTSYCFATNIKTWYSENTNVEHGVLLCMAAFISGLFGLVPYLLYLKIEHGPALAHLITMLLKSEPGYLIGITFLGCAANISTIFLYSSTEIHSVQYLRCASPIFAAAVSILTREDTLSWSLSLSLSFIVFGLILAVWKDQKFTLLSLGVGLMINVMIICRNAGVKRLVARFHLESKSIISVLLLAFSYGFGFILSILYCLMHPKGLLDDGALLIHSTTLKVAFYSLSYNMLSYLALSEIGLVTHSLLEQGKRFFIICVFCLVAQQCPKASVSFWLGVVMIAFGSAIYWRSKQSTTDPLQRFMSSFPTGRLAHRSVFLHAAILTLLLTHLYKSDPMEYIVSRHSDISPLPSTKVLFVFLGRPPANELPVSSAIRHAVNPWRADTALIGDTEDKIGNLSLGRANYRWETPEGYDWSRILSMIPGVDSRWTELFCRFRIDAEATARECLPDSFGTLLAHQYVAQQHIIELERMGHAYDWYAIAPLHYLYICDMEPLSSFSRHAIHIARGDVDSGQTDHFSLIPSHLVVEALNYTAFVLSYPSLWNQRIGTQFLHDMGTLLDQFHRDQALSYEKIFFPGVILEKYASLPEALFLEQVFGHLRGLYPNSICPKTNIRTELDILVNFSKQLLSQPVSAVRSCADERYDLAGDCNKTSNNTLFFFDWNGNNFGDELSPKIVQSVSSLKTFKTIDRDLSSLKGNVITGLGSILHDVMSHVESVDVLHIWGSGAHERLCHVQPQNKLPEIRVHAVRGPLTAACLNSVLEKANSKTADSSYVYGDPGLLVPFMYPTCQKANIPTCRVCIIPHKSDEALAKADFEFQRLELLGCAKMTAHSPEMIVGWIVGCSKVISSSLHGIIVAEAFGIPSVWLQLPGSQNSENSFKYLDYYLATGRENATPALTIQSALDNPSIDPIADSYNAWDLIDNFPYESWGGCRPLKPRNQRHA